MIKINYARFFLIIFMISNSSICLGSDQAEELLLGLKRARSHSFNDSPNNDMAPLSKKRKLNPRKGPVKSLSSFSKRKDTDLVLGIASYIRIVDTLAFTFTCRTYAASLQENRLWQKFVQRIPGHHAFLGEKSNNSEKGFYKNLFKKLMKPSFHPLRANSKDVCSEVYALSNQGSIFWGDITTSTFTDYTDEDVSEENEESEDFEQSNSMGLDSEDTCDSTSLSQNNETFDKATYWHEGKPRFVPTSQDVHESNILGANHNSHILVGSYCNNDSTSSTKAAIWARTPLGHYQMISLPDNEAGESIAKTVNKNGRKFAGVLYNPFSQAVVWEDNELSYLEVPATTLLSFATSMDASGDRIVGYIETCEKKKFPMLWIGKQAISLPPHPFANGDLVARVISGDGTTIAGYAQLVNTDQDVITELPTVWTLSEDYNPGLPTPKFGYIEVKSQIEVESLSEPCGYVIQNIPQAINYKGNRIVGTSRISSSKLSLIIFKDQTTLKSSEQAVIWIKNITPYTRSFLLHRLLGKAVPKNFILTEATCIDETGTIIGGNGYPSAWWAYLPDMQALEAEGILIQNIFPSS